MPDREKVIKGLTECVAAGLEKACPADCPYFLKCFPDVGLATPFMSLMADALSMLKEQEPVEPKVIGTNSFGDPVHACGKCGILITESMNYCNGCGRKVKWNDLGIL